MNFKGVEYNEYQIYIHIMFGIVQGKYNLEIAMSIKMACRQLPKGLTSTGNSNTVHILKHKT